MPANTGVFPIAPSISTVQHTKPWWHSPYLALSLTSFFWALNWVIGRAVVGQIPPAALAYWRWVLAVLFLLPFAWPQIRRSRYEIWANRWIICAIAVVGTGYHNLFSYLGLNYTTATNGVILNSSTPIMIVVLGALFFGVRTTRLQLTGVGISLAGVLAILTQGHLETLAGLRFNKGDLIVFGSMVLWALYTLSLKWRPAKIPPLAFLCTCGAIGVIAMTPAYAWEIASGKSIVWSWPVAGAFLYVGIFPSVVGYILWNRGVAEVGPSIAGLFFHLMPVFGALLSWMFLGERLQWFHFAGVALIFAGIWLTSRPEKT
jgi:drug/metabolite transporter (DMT)-like permease